VNQSSKQRKIWHFFADFWKMHSLGIFHSFFSQTGTNHQCASANAMNNALPVLGAFEVVNGGCGFLHFWALSPNCLVPMVLFVGVKVNEYSQKTIKPIAT